jgi:branched-chain amino acid transport system substrate-binding protein
MEVGAMTIRAFRCASALVGTLALLGVACAPAEEATEEFEPGPLGAVTVGPEDPIKIASIQAVSGETASLGTDQVRAVQIAIADRGDELLGHSVELVELDDGCAAEQGTTAAQRVVADPQIVGVLGTSCSGAAVPAMEIFADEGITMISGSNTSPALTSDLEGNANPAHQQGYFRTAHNDITQGQAAATFAVENLGATRAATIHDGDPYTEGLASAFGVSFQELGGEVVLATAISKGDTDMRPILTEVAATTPDVVFFPIFQPEADFIVRQATEFPELADTEKLFGADGLLSDTFIVIAETEGMYFSGPATPTGTDYEELVGSYAEEFGERPIQAFHAHSYDAANMLFGAIEEVAVEEDDGTVHVDRQALMDALYELEGFEGLTGTLTCDEFGDCADVKIDIVQNTAGHTTIEQVRGNVLDSFEFGD